MPRAALNDLVDVVAGELIVRAVNPGAFDATRPVGQRVQTAAIPSGDFTPSDTSYGASVFVETLLPGGVETLRVRRPDWARYGLARLIVSDVVALGVRVALSPDDCADEVLRPAHASLIGVDRLKRNRLIRLVEDGLFRYPATV